MRIPSIEYWKRLIVASICALVVGATAGDIADMVSPTAYRAKQHAVSYADELACLREALYYEGRSGLVGEQIMQGMVILARVKDPDPQWPKTICGVVRQPGQFSYLRDIEQMSRPVESAAWARADSLAQRLMNEAWKTQLLPRGAECVRSYKLSDKKLAKLQPVHLAQLQIASGSGLGFFARTQVPVFTVGNHSFYQHRDGCKNPLPTT